MSLLSDIGTAIKNKLGGTSVDNTVPRYDGTTCKLQGSGVTISDTNAVTASGGFVGNLTGNAATATKLATSRTINGVSFNGTANIVAPTNLNIGTITATAVPIESSSGTNASIPAATTALAGVMSSADKVKLDGIAANANNYVLPARLGSVALLIADWNLAVENGWYMGANALNAPNAEWNIGTVEVHNSLWVTQTVRSFTSDSSSNSVTWGRQMNNGTWGNWYRLQLTQEEQDARYVQGNDSRLITNGDQTITGVKTFSSSPIVPTPTTGTQAANKGYVDTNIGQLNTDLYQGPYGFSWDYATDTYIRTGAKGYTAIQSKMRRCVLKADGSVNYYLHPYNSNFKENGTPSVLTGADGNVMVEIPKHYIKVETVGNVDSFSISLTQEPGYVLDPSFMKWNGTAMVEVPYRYFRAYTGFVSNDKLLSVSGVTPTRYQIIATFRTQAMANGAGWHLTDWNLLNTIKRLCYIEFCDFIVTKYLGEGNHTGNDYGITTGQSNALGNRSSNSTHNDKYMSYRGIENMYADIWEYVDGININNYQAYVNQKWSTFESNVFSGDYVAKGPLIAAGASNSLIKRCNVSADGGFIPTTIGGSTTTFYGDALWSATEARIAFYGGSATDGASGGLGALCVHGAASGAGAQGVVVGAAVCR